MWEEIPEELRSEWGTPVKGEGNGNESEGGVSSVLTSLSDFEYDVDEEDEDEEDDYEEEEEEEVAPVVLPKLRKGAHTNDWESEYWAERARCEEPGFVEWEAVSSIVSSI